MIEAVGYAEVAPLRSRAAADHVALAPTGKTDWFAERDAAGQIVSVGGLIAIGSGFRVKGLWVRPECRGAEHGVRMVRFLVDQAVQRCASHIEAISVRPALWHRLGFTAIGAAPTGAAIMRRVL